MKRSSDAEVATGEAVLAELQGRCLACGFVGSRRPRGCKAGHCANCGHPYPLGDCSD